MFAILFAAILKVMPDVHLRWSDVWAGGFFIAVLFVVGKFLIGIYLAHAGKASAYGAAGSIALILMWTYYSAPIFLLGVEFTQVWVCHRGREARPKQGAVRLEPIASRAIPAPSIKAALRWRRHEAITWAVRGPRRTAQGESRDTRQPRLSLSREKTERKGRFGALLILYTAG